MSLLDSTQVREIMTREVSVVSAEDPLLVASRAMFSSNFSCVIVDLKDPALGFGILTQKDLVLRLSDYGPSYPGATVRDAMSHPCVTLSPDFNLTTSLDLMRMVGVRRAPVVEHSKLVGILSFTDIFRWSMQRLERSAA